MFPGATTRHNRCLCPRLSDPGTICSVTVSVTVFVVANDAFCTIRELTLRFRAAGDAVTEGIDVERRMDSTVARVGAVTVRLSLWLRG